MQDLLSNSMEMILMLLIHSLKTKGRKKLKNKIDKPLTMHYKKLIMSWGGINKNKRRRKLKKKTRQNKSQKKKRRSIRAIAIKRKVIRKSIIRKIRRLKLNHQQ